MFAGSSKHLRIRRAAVALLSVVALLTAPACTQARPSALPEELGAPEENTTLGPGDVFRLEIVGEPDLPKEFQVAADGTVNVPYIQTIKVAGLEPQEVAARVREKLVADKILTDPSVVVAVIEYRSKRVTVLGQVQHPGSFGVTPGLTLIQALSLGGGLTSIAQKDQVTLSRSRQGKTITVVINAEEISSGRAADIPLQPGDRIYVPERVF